MTQCSPGGEIVSDRDGWWKLTLQEAFDWHLKLESRVRELEAELAVADKGLLKASDPKSGWAEISKECKLWQERAEQAEAERDRLKEDIENPKMTYCAFCGEAYDIQDREKALELITEHVSVCPKHPIAELRARHAALVEAAQDAHCPKCGSAGWVWGHELDDPDNDTATDTMTRYTCDWCRKLKAALAEVKG
jgi:hypothetical protein